MSQFGTVAVADSTADATRLRAPCAKENADGVTRNHLTTYEVTDAKASRADGGQK